MGVFSHAGHTELTLVMAYLGAANKIGDIEKRICLTGSCFSGVTQEI